MTRTVLQGSSFVFALFVVFATGAQAQITIDAAGTTPEAAPAASSPAPSGASAGGTSASAEDGGDDGYFHYDGYRPRVDSAHQVLVPQFHVVESGDTLWEISHRYFNSPWEWPRVWSYNPTITSPHWIYPGDLVRLIPGGALAAEPGVVAPTPGNVGSEPAVTKRLQPHGVKLRQLAFVHREAFRGSARVAGSVQEKTLLTTGDRIYLTYDPKRAPKVGGRYAIYSERQPVKHPATGRHLGFYVNVLGELEILRRQRNKLAIAIVRDAVDLIERGHRVGPLQKTYQRVLPNPNQRNLRGRIIAMLHHDQLIGESEVVFIDLTEKDGVKKGNRLHVVRRGDAYSQVMGPGQNTGQDDSRFPNRIIGELLVVQPGKHQSVALVTMSSKEAGVGDIVVMRRAE